MTRVCLLGADDVTLRYELLSRETSRQALQTYDLTAPYANAIGLETVSLGAAVSLLNDLNWYIVRFVAEALVLEPSVSETEWLSRELATAIRDNQLVPGETGRLLKLYGIEHQSSSGKAAGEGRLPAPGTDRNRGESGVDEEPESDERETTEPTTGDELDGGRAPGQSPRLVEPMLVTRTGGGIPEYDIRDVDDTLVVRVTESEFEDV